MRNVYDNSNVHPISNLWEGFNQVIPWCPNKIPRTKNSYVTVLLNDYYVKIMIHGSVALKKYNKLYKLIYPSIKSDSIVH